MRGSGRRGKRKEGRIEEGQRSLMKRREALPHPGNERTPVEQLAWHAPPIAAVDRTGLAPDDPRHPPRQSLSREQLRAARHSGGRARSRGVPVGGFCRNAETRCFTLAQSRCHE